MTKAKIQMTEQFDLPPQDIYVVKVMKVEFRESTVEQYDDYISVQFEITKGANKGKWVFSNLGLRATPNSRTRKFIEILAPELWEDEGELSVAKMAKAFTGKVCRGFVEEGKKANGDPKVVIKNILPLTDDNDDEGDEEEEKPKGKGKGKGGKKKSAPEPEEDDEGDDEGDDDGEEEGDGEEEEQQVFPPPARIKKMKAKDLKHIVGELGLDPSDYDEDTLRQIVLTMAAIHDKEEYGGHDKKALGNTLKIIGLGKPKKGVKPTAVAKQIGKKIAEIITELQSGDDEEGEDGDDEDGDDEDVDW